MHRLPHDRSVAAGHSEDAFQPQQTIAGIVEQRGEPTLQRRSVHDALAHQRGGAYTAEMAALGIYSFRTTPLRR